MTGNIPLRAVALGVVDYATGPEMALSIRHLPPIACIAGFVERAGGPASRIRRRDGHPARRKFFHPSLSDMFKDTEVIGGGHVRRKTARKRIQRDFEVRLPISGSSEARWRTG
jgi:hypothetical protein